jgi:ATP-binding cassette subfamily B multidrug efflux pump
MFSDERLTEEEIVEAAKKAAIYDNIMEFPEKFDTVLGERGINLSGGQKQRISIARAIIKSPEILIFDDCLSAVDTETEDKILRSLSQIMEGKTSVIISHRISSILGADHILVLDKGKIIMNSIRNN